jgi:signal-transduction protein with cAMP-binding, CBS, and nucleotidyltransferase domain
VFALKVAHYPKGTILQSPGEDASSLFFLQKGIIEVSTRFEGLDFVIERLFRGSVLNYRTFFMEEGAAVQLRFGKASIMQELPYTEMQKLLKKYPEFNKVFMQFRL